MPRITNAALTASLLIGLSSTATALSSPDAFQETAPTPESQTQPELSENLTAINHAVELTKHDPEAFCFVIALPSTFKEARQMRDQWIAAQAHFDETEHPVFFVMGDDADFVLENSFINQAPAAIVFRDGRPFHTRTGALTQKNIHTLIAIALDDTAPTTNAPDQTQYLFESMNQLAAEGKETTAAQGACNIMLNLHALIHGPYASSFSEQDLESMSSIYTESQIALGTLDHTNPAVLDQIQTASAMGLKTWNKRTNSTFGIGIFFDLALVTGDTDPVLDWVDQGFEGHFLSRRVAQSLAEFGQPLAGLLTATHRYEALAATYTSPSQITESFESIATSSTEELIWETQEATEQAAAYHAALLLVGRDDEAWEVARITQQFAGNEAASASLCTAALNAGVLQDRHAFFVEHLDQSTHASLINDMNSSFAVVPGTDE
ncbi:MAG: hypothetical protein JJ974_03580 [Phycisphaerales bacterium]|nr:hypothetical protein [Phycisphaerales bacterium]